MRAVAVGVNPAHRDITKDPALKVRVVCVHAGVIYIDEDIAARQPEIVFRGERVGGDGNARSAQVVGEHAGARKLDFLHAGKAGQGGQDAGLTHGDGLAGCGSGASGQHPEHRPEWRRFFVQDLQAELVQIAEGSLAGIREEQQVKRLVIRQRLLLHGQSKQWLLELEIRLIGHDSLRPRVRPQPLRGGLGCANEISLVGNIGHDGGPGSLQTGAERSVRQRASLDDISARITPCTQMIGNRQGNGLGRVEQCVFEQDGRGAAEQLAEGRRGVAEPEGGRVRDP